MSNSVEPQQFQKEKEFASLSLKIREIVSSHLGLSLNDVAIDSHLLKDLSAGGLDLLEIVLAIEEKFDVDMPDDIVEVAWHTNDTPVTALDASKMTAEPVLACTLRELVEYLQKQIGET